MSAETTAHLAVDKPRWFTNVEGMRIEFDDIVHCWRIPGESPEDTDAFKVAFHPKGTSEEKTEWVDHRTFTELHPLAIEYIAKLNRGADAHT